MSKNKGNKGDKTSFWKLLKDYRVEVPIIQRDYAQGRVGKEFLRTKFLEDLKKALDNEDELVLDDRADENLKRLLHSLDAWQCQVASWLVLWYLACKSKNLNAEASADPQKESYKVKDVLKELIPQTNTSKEFCGFCENLCDPKNFESFNDGKIVDFIEAQTRFSSAWKRDPTIQSMLQLLGGDIGKLLKDANHVEYWDKLKGCLSSKVELVLDFVYGSEKERGETKIIRPLDGQQRLTTLWLLHWYIALRAGELKKEENCKVLRKFTYETRISSREFCENLCDPKNFESFNDGKIVDFIEAQTWFYSAWKQDPTIQSMLRMLGGTETNDSIEKLFEKTNYGKYWEKIKGNLDSKRKLRADGVGRKARKFLLSLDGRQRPLALWLLFWYVEYKARLSTEKGSEDRTKNNEKVLKERIPETLRKLIPGGTNASKFCDNLCNSKKFKSFNGEEIVGSIKKQEWFSDTWEQDPTIQSMLRMLGGTENNDSIEKLFKDADYKEYWGKLKDYLDSESKPKLDGCADENLEKLLKPLKDDAWQCQVAIWLLLWYLWKSKKLNTRAPYEAKNVLKEKKPISLSRFCERLVSFKEEQQDGVGIVEHIKKQKWFSATWEQDSTIQSAIRFLGGTKSSDGIEDVFEGGNYETFWKKLTSKYAPPIAFYYLRLENFGLSDDLYVKMNARGKPLTPFENFKADLIGYLSKRALGEDDKLAEDEREEWIRLYGEIPAKLDTYWADIFWDKRSNKNKKDKKDDEQKIDEIYFAFLNRFFWNELFVAKTKNEYVLRFSKGSKLESPNSSFEYLDKDSVDEYLGIECYEFLDGEIPISVFKNLERVLDNYKKYNGEIHLLYGFKDFKFIPEYRGNNNEENEGNNSEKKKGNNSEKKKGNNSEEKVITGISRVQRVIFFALCKYFNEETAGEANFVALKCWIRVVCNLISGKDLAGTPYIRDYPTVRNALEYISKLKSHAVLESLGDTDDDKADDEGVELIEDADSAFKQQWNEEITKAKQILKDEEKWGKVIIDAEESAFFEGSIRFLYQNYKGVENWDLNEFKEKWGKAKEYFGTGENHKNNVTDIMLLKVFIGKFREEDFEKVLLWDSVKQNRAAQENKDKMVLKRPANWTWMSYLTNQSLCYPVHEFLTMKKMEGQLCPGKEDGVIKYALYLLTKTQLLDRVMEEFEEFGIRYDDKDKKHLVVRKFGNNQFTRGNQFVLLNTSKYDFLLDQQIEQEGRKEQEIPPKIPKTNLHFEFADIYFGYEDYNYLRYGKDGFIYLLDSGIPEEDKRAIVVDSEKANSKNEYEKYYCFDPEGLSTKDILEKLKGLAKDWENSKNHTPPEKEEGKHGAEE